ncbi:MAG: hypothetical protein RR505_05990 [Raoultibacter sp.]
MSGTSTVYENTIAAIFDRLSIFFTEGTLTELYNDIPAPVLSVGEKASKKPMSVIIDNMPSKSNAEASDKTIRLSDTFSVHISIAATDRSKDKARHICLAYVDCVTNAILAEWSLSGVVERALPGIESSETELLSNKDNRATAVVSIECTVRGTALAPYKEVLNGSTYKKDIA